MVTVTRGHDIILRNKVDQLLDETQTKDERIDEIITLLKDLQAKLDQQGKVLTKIAVYISKLYHDGEINKETFEKLDEFLKPYYNNSNLEQDY